MKLRALDCITYPKDVKVAIKDRVVTVTGPKGTLKRDLRHLQLDFRNDKKQGKLSAIRWFGNRIEIACIKTALTHIRNMVTGVTKGYRYKLRFAYAHFPINVTTEGQNLEIRNFLGEKIVRRLVIPDGLTVYRTDAAKVKDELVVDGCDLEKVSYYAALIHQSCMVKNKDIRKFLDGIYVQTKMNIA